jgi:flagellar basal body-associated protein FliL
MADEDERNEQKATKEEKPSKGGILKWVILGVIIAVCAGSGFVLGRLLAGSPASEPNAPAQEDQQPQSTEPEAADSEQDTQDMLYYDLTPVVANLNEPKVTRYVRATLTLAINRKADKKGPAFFENKKPYIINWLTIYLASQSLEDIRGEKNLKRIQSEVKDLLNEKLFPDSKPPITRVLFREFAVQ